MVAKSCRACGTVCQGSICDDCRIERDRLRERQRPSASARGYDARYRRARNSVVQRARNGEPCCICRELFQPGELVTAEHVIPVRRGGTGDESNLAPAHARCNYAWNKKR